jgi:hypothetical protein
MRMGRGPEWTWRPLEYVCCASSESSGGGCYTKNVVRSQGPGGGRLSLYFESGTCRYVSYVRKYCMETCPPLKSVDISVMICRNDPYPLFCPHPPPLLPSISSTSPVIHVYTITLQATNALFKLLDAQTPLPSSSDHPPRPFLPHSLSRPSSGFHTLRRREPPSNTRQLVPPDFEHPFLTSFFSPSQSQPFNSSDHGWEYSFDLES